MKIALCLSGQARSFEKGYVYYKKNLLDKYNVDVFIHSWKFEQQEQYVDLYKPKEFTFATPLHGDYDEKYTHTPDPVKFPPRFTVSMLFSMFHVSKILTMYQMKNNLQYDWVIRSRPDYALNTVIPFGDLDNSKLYIPNCRMVPERDFGNDQFAFSSSENMLKYMSTFALMEHYYTDLNTLFIGENLMQANLHEHNLHGENLVYVDMNNPFPPGKHNGTWHSLIRDDYEQWTQKS